MPAQRPARGCAGVLHGRGDVEAAARLIDGLCAPTYNQTRIATPQRWLRWLDDRDGMEGHLTAAVFASILAAASGRPTEAERWADAVDRWLN